MSRLLPHPLIKDGPELYGELLIDPPQGAPIAGYLLQAHGGEKSTLAAYHPAMFYAGSMALVALGLVGMVRMYIDKHIMRKV